jgi:Sulfotransferase family
MLVWALAALTVLGVRAVPGDVASPAALLSSQCRLRAVAAWQARKRNGTAPCGPYCGPLPTASSVALPFLERLMPACQDTMARYAAPGHAPTGRMRDMPPLVDCAATDRALGATAPVVVHRGGIEPFIFATVPKAGCTNLRKLLATLIKLEPFRHLPDLRPGRNVTGIPRAHADVHDARFPTVFHYEPLEGDLRGHIPTFVVSRNPYERLVSGFLDKMTTDHDPYIKQVRASILQSVCDPVDCCAIDARDSSRLADCKPAQAERACVTAELPQITQHMAAPRPSMDCIRTPAVLTRGTIDARARVPAPGGHSPHSCTRAWCAANKQRARQPRWPHVSRSAHGLRALCQPA